MGAVTYFIQTYIELLAFTAVRTQTTLCARKKGYPPRYEKQNSVLLRRNSAVAAQQYGRGADTHCQTPKTATSFRRKVDGEPMGTPKGRIFGGNYTETAALTAR